MQSNWDHFYWLTGEVPSSFNSLLQQLRRIYHQRPGGKCCALDLRNQVKRLIHNLKENNNQNIFFDRNTNNSIFCIY